MTNTPENTEAQIPAKGMMSNTMLFLGIALLILGFIAVGAQFLFTIGTVMFFGALMLVAGVAELIHVFTSKQEKKVFSIISSVIYIVTGVLTLNNPLVGALGLTLVMSVFFILAGGARVAYAIFHRQQPQWIWFLLGGVINWMLGLMILAGWPVTGLWIIGLFVGIEMIFHGFSWIMLSFVLRSADKKA